MGAGALAEDFEDQAGAVDNLGLPASLEIALLHRRHGAVDNDEADRVVLDALAEMFDGAAAEQGCRRGVGDADDFGADDIEMDRARKPDRFFKPRFGRTRGVAIVRRAADFAAGCTTSARPRRRAVCVQGAVVFVSNQSSSLSLPGSNKLDRLRRHHRRDRMFIDQLRMCIAAQQHAEIIKPGDDPLQLDAIHQKHGDRRLVLADVVQKQS